MTVSSGKLEHHETHAEPLRSGPTILYKPAPLHTILHGLTIALLILVVILLFSYRAHGQGGPGAFPFTFDSSTNLKVNCITGCSASAGFADLGAFTAGSTVINLDGGVFNDGLAGVVSGKAAAARITPNRALHINLRNNSGTEIGTASNPLRFDPTGSTTQPVSGTFWQSTQPVSIADGSDTTLGAKADAKNTATDATAISIMSVLKEISALEQAPASTPVTGTFWQGTQPVSGTVTTTPPANASTNVAQIGGTAVLADPCQTSTKLYISITQTANTKLVVGTSAKKMSICSIHLVTATAQNIALVEGTVTTCGTGTAGVSGFGGATAATGWNLAANGGLTYGNGSSALGQEGTAADDLCLFQSGSGQVSGGLTYVVQ